MLSEQKSLLRIAEVMALVGSMVSLWLAIRNHAWPDPDFPVILMACGGMAALLLTFLPACMLAGEYVRTVRRPQNWRAKTEGLNPSEVQALLRWAPKTYSISACIGVLIAIGSALKFGSITFSEGQSVSAAEATGMALYFSVFFLLALPVLGSAVRMPGSYADNET